MHVRLHHLIKRYPSTTAVDVPSLTLSAGEIVGLIGRNGAGKTTLLRLILDLVVPTEGQVLIDGHDVRRSTAWKMHAAAYLEEGFLIPFLTPTEYLFFVGTAYGLDRSEIHERIAGLSPLIPDSLLTTPSYIRTLSTGNKQRVGLSAALLVHPRLLVLDEPFDHLDPPTREHLKHLLLRLHRHLDTTILLTSHNVPEIADFIHRVLIMDEGRIVRDVSDLTTIQHDLTAHFDRTGPAS